MPRPRTCRVRVCAAALLLVGALLTAGTRSAAGQEAFVTIWETDSSNVTITIPTASSASSYDFTIDWGDGTTKQITGEDPDPSHTYAQAGTYTVEITGTFPRIFLDADPPLGDGDATNAENLRSIDQWGSIQWESMNAAFAGAANMTYNATDTPDLTNVTDMSRMFRGARSFNGAIGGWNVSSVTDMTAMFSKADTFNQAIGGWDVSNVTDMSRMFRDADSFNQDIGAWNVSSVTSLRSMFNDANAFNQDIGGWDVSNITDMHATFKSADSFNQDISGWDVSSVTDMSAMFNAAFDFNKNIGGWNVSNVTTMERMFSLADAFNQAIGGWDVSNVTNMETMFESADAFNRDISGWDVSSVTNMEAMFQSAEAFNQDIGEWNVSNVTDMSRMFRDADAFNQDIGGWNVSGVTDMTAMFSKADTFNQDIGGWDVSNVTTMGGMFAQATAFDQDLGGWDVSNVTVFEHAFFRGFLEGAELSPSNYDALLTGWERLNLTDGLTFDAGASQYTEAAQSARRAIIDEDGWTIRDGGLTASAPAPPTDLAVTTAPGAIRLDWTASSTGGLARYRLYRSTAPIDSAAGPSGLSPLDSTRAGTTSFVDTGVASGTTYHYRGTAVDSSGDESGFSGEVQATPPIALSTRVPAAPVPPGTAIEIEVTVPPGFAPTTGSLFYREAGQRDFQKTEVSVAGLPSTTDTTLTAEVPAEAVTERGAQYYVRLSQRVGDDTLRATAPSRVPVRLGFVQTQVERATASGPFRAESYRMMSVPLDLGTRTVRDVLVEQYGTYDPTEWRLFRWSPADSTYQENDQIRPPLSAGQAAWLITDDGDPLVVQDGRSIPSGSPDTIALQPGWNQIGNPFPFPVAWKEVEGTDAVGEIAEYDGTRPQGNRYRFDVAALRPWRGYFVLNTTGSRTSLVVPPRGANPTALTLHEGASSPRTAPSPGYHLRAVTRVPWGDSSLVDRQAQMGFQPGAAAGVGSEDTQKPPPVGPHVRVAITPAEGPVLARSWKPLSDQGARWDLRVSLWPGAPSATNRPAAIHLEERGTRPDGFRQYVLDLDRDRRLPVTHGTVVVEGLGDNTPRHLRVIVGTEAFAHRASGGTSLTFERTRLLANVPNPFQRSTTIAYQLAESEDVTIRVYDVLGRRVETLVDGRQPAGVHEVTWQAGGMASGVYFCRMQVGKYTATRKMTIVR